jgi:hypothetical protein
MAEGCCPKCGSRLYHDDERYMKHAGVCGGCVSWDKTPNKRYQKAYDEGIDRENMKSAERMKKRGDSKVPQNPWWRD